MTNEAQTTHATDIATLPPAERALIVLNATKTEADLKQMVADASHITEIKDPAGREQAHRMGMKLKTARTTIEKTGKAARDDANAFSKAVINEEKRLISIVEGEEKRVLGLRDAFDAKLAAEKEAKERAERERVAGIQSKIDAIRALPLQSARDTSAEIEATLKDLTEFVITEDEFQELIADAQTARHQAMIELREMLAAAKSREAADAAVAEERARLAAEAERLAAENAAAAERAAAAEAEAAALRAQLAALQAQHAPAGGDTGQLAFAQKTVSHEEARELFPAGDSGAVSEPGGEAEDVELRVPADVAAAVAADPDGAVQALQDATDQSQDADALVVELSSHTALQFQALAKKVEACGFAAYANDLRNVATRLVSGELHNAIKLADWNDIADADKAMAIASHACVALILGDDAMGASVLRGAA